MRNLVRRFFFVLCGLVVLGMPVMAAGSHEPAKAVAASVAPPTIAIVVDIQRVLDESLAAKSVQKQLESQRARFQSEIEKEENELGNAEKDLNKSRDTVAPDIFADREQQLRQRFLVVERHVQARRKALDQAFSDSMNTVHANLQDIVKDAALAHHANIVLTKQQVLWSDKPLDATDEILNKLNAQLPAITIKVPVEDDIRKAE